MKNMWMIVLIVLPLLALAYVGWHIWVLLPLPVWAKIIIEALCVGCFALLFMSMARKFDSLPLPLAQTFYEIGTSSIFILLYLVLVFVALDLCRLFHLVPKSIVFGSWYGAAGIVILLGMVFLFGNLRYKDKKKVELELKSAVPLSKPYRVVMLSDLHLGYHNTRREFSRWVDMINAEQPDFILIAGDIIDGSMRPLIEENMASEFRRLKSPVYACLGNHEYYAGEPLARQFYEDAGINLLIDESVSLGGDIVILGRDDRTNLRRKSVSQLVSAKPKGKYTIVLDHQPYHLERSEKAGVDFQLSGHTHRGQVWPISWITDAIYECSWGSHKRGNTNYYISSGMGIWGGKFRIGTQSEYVVATIR